MKKQSIVSIAKKSTVILSSLFLVAATNSNVKAAYHTPTSIVDSLNSTAEVMYAGLQDGMLAFKVNYKNITGEKFTLKVKDSNGDIIYIQDFTDKNFNKTFLLARDIDTEHFTFIIGKRGNETTQSFKVGFTTQVYENVVVSRL
jgi:hypothetical protein